MNIDCIIEYHSGYVLFIHYEEDDRYSWQITKAGCEIEASRYALSLDSTIEEGRAALRSHVSYEAFAAKWQKRAGA